MKIYNFSSLFYFYFSYLLEIYRAELYSRLENKRMKKEVREKQRLGGNDESPTELQVNNRDVQLLKHQEMDKT